MIFRPIQPMRRPRPVVFITDAGPSLLEVTTEHGGVHRKTAESAIELLLHGQDRVALYSLVKPKQLVSCLGFNRWQVVKYHNRIVRLRFDEHVNVYPFSTLGPDPQALLPFFDAIKKLGVNPASMSTMVRNTWLRLLTEPVWIKEWGNDNAGRQAFHGGRKEALIAPASFSGAKYVDLSGAYLQAMRTPIPCHIRKVDSGQLPANGFAAGTVFVPPGKWGPLPFQMGSGKRGARFTCYGNGIGSGAWHSEELATAMAGGTETVELTDCWEGYKPRPIFETWLPWALDLRTLPGQAGLAAKLLTTRLWSMFAMNPDQHRRTVVTFGDAKGRDRHEQVGRPGGRTMGQATYIAAIIASRVRVRLYRELLASPGAIYCDTDGGIVPATTSVDGWRETRRMERLEIKGCQAFRWKCPECGEDRGHPPWHYSIAGVPSDSDLCEALFRYAMPGQLWDLGPYSLTLPAGDLGEVKASVAGARVLPAPLEGESL
jgi:hypothetical protein